MSAKEQEFVRFVKEIAWSKDKFVKNVEALGNAYAREINQKRKNKKAEVGSSEWRGEKITSFFVGLTRSYGFAIMKL